MSPQSVFPRVRQRLREEAADQFGAPCGNQHGMTDLPIPSTSGKKRWLSGKNLPEISASASGSGSSSASGMGRARTPPVLPSDAGQQRHPPRRKISGSRASSSAAEEASQSSLTASCGQLKNLSLLPQDDAVSVSSTSSFSSTGTRCNSCPPPSLLAFHKTAPASVGGSNSGSTSNSYSNLVISPLPRAALRKSSLYELQAALDELSRALADMETTAKKRARVRSQAYLIKFEAEYADLVRVKDRAIKRLDALLRRRTGGPQSKDEGYNHQYPSESEEKEQQRQAKPEGAFPADSKHAQLLAHVLMVVMDLDDELLMLMGEEHGTWEELKRLRGDIRLHLKELEAELGRGAGPGEGSPKVGERDFPAIAPISRSLSSHSGGRPSGGRRDAHSPLAVSFSMPTCLESGPGGLGLAPGSGGGGVALSRKGKGRDAACRLRSLDTDPAKTKSAQKGALHDPDSPSGTVTTSSLSSSASSAFSNVSDQAVGLTSDEERSLRGPGKCPSTGCGKSVGEWELRTSCLAPPPASMSRAVSSDGLSLLLQRQHQPPLSIALTQNVKERATFIHHRALASTTSSLSPSVPPPGLRASYHRRVCRPQVESLEG